MRRRLAAKAAAAHDRPPSAMSRRLGAKAALVAVAAASAGLVAGPAPARADDCGPQSPGSGATFSYTGAVQHVRIPIGVERVVVEALGGHGGSNDHTAPGGAGGLVTATLPVTGGECLDVHVGQQGTDDGGWGWGFGGDRGTSAVGYNSAGGGGASALVRGVLALVVAGGGGGGGAVGREAIGSDHPGGRGGAGSGHGGPGDWTGQNGENTPVEDEVQGGQGGWGHDGRQGGTGEHGPAGPSGAGGGGGGGSYGGQGGASYSGEYAYASVGGAGGGGGSSAVDAGAIDSHVAVGTEPCPTNGSPACDGKVKLTWVVHPARIVAYGGSGQSTAITTRFPRPLQARVLAASGYRVPGATVRFELPASGATGSFDDIAGGIAATAVANDDGVATAPAILAGAAAGDWRATATVEGVEAAAHFSLRNEPAQTATALAASAHPSVAGEPVRFAATVASFPSSAGVPSGTVRFTVDGNHVPQAATVDAAGVAISEPIALPVGTHVVRAHFVGDGDFAASDAELTQRVERGQAAVSLASSHNPSEAGAQVSFTATVAAAPPASGTPTGAVRFEVDDEPLGDPVPLAAGSATSPPVALDARPRVVEAFYAGDDEFVGAAATLAQSVGAGATATEVASDTSPSEYGEPVTVTATMRSDAGTPVGLADFQLDGDDLCTGVTLEDGRAHCALPDTIGAGDHAVTVVYTPASPTFAASQGRALQRVIPARTTLGVLATPGPSVFGQRYTLHADVGALGPGSGAPSGSVQFRVDGAALGTPVDIGIDGAISPALAPLPAGAHVVQASSGGDADFAGSTGAAPYVVDRAESTATVASPAEPSAAGADVTFVTRVDLVEPGSGSAGGSVQFRVDGVDRGAPVELRHGSATSAAVSGLAPGDHDVRASYLGDGNVAPTEATAVHTVSATAGPPGPGSGTGTQAPSNVGPGTARALGTLPLCRRPIVLTEVRRHGRRVRLSGIARGEYLGRRVTIVSGGRAVARTTVRRDGGFRVRARRPTGRHWRRADYQARVAGRRSPTVPLVRAVRIVSRRTMRDGRVRLRARLVGTRARTVAVVRRRGCDASTARRVARVRADRRGRLTVTVAPPRAGSEPAVYRLRTARPGSSSLPVVVEPRR
jgi:hypothetical protein